MLSAVKAVYIFLLLGVNFYQSYDWFYDYDYDYPFLWESGDDRGWYHLNTDFGMRESGEVLKDHRIKLGVGFTFTTASSSENPPFEWGLFDGKTLFPIFAHFSFDIKIVKRWDGVFRLSIFPVSFPDYLISAGMGIKTEIFRALSGSLIISIEPLLEYNGGSKRYDGESVGEGPYVSHANGIGFALPLWITYKGNLYFFVKAKTGYTDSELLETGWMDVGMGGGFEFGRNHSFGIELYYFHKRLWGMKVYELEPSDFWNFLGISAFFNFRVLKLRDDSAK